MFKEKYVLIVGLILSLMMTACGPGYELSNQSVTELVKDTPLENDPEITKIDKETEEAIIAMEKVVADVESEEFVDDSIIDELNATNNVLKIRKLLKKAVGKLGDSLLSGKDKIAEVKQEVQDKIDSLDPNLPGYEKAKERLEEVIEKLTQLEFKLEELADKIKEKLEELSDRLDDVLERIAELLTKWDFTGITTAILENKLKDYKDKLIDKVIDKLLGV